MTDAQINTAIARLTGMSEEDIEHGWVPDYAIDYGDIHQAIKSFDYETQNDIAWIIKGGLDGPLSSLLTAPPRKMAEAVLRAHGKWEEVQG